MTSKGWINVQWSNRIKDSKFLIFRIKLLNEIEIQSFKQLFKLPIPPKVFQSL